MTVPRSPTASLTACRIRPSSATVVVGDSPVVPLTTTPSWPWSSRWAAMAAVPSRSTSPSSVNAVAIAVNRRPNGAAEVMGVRLPRRPGHPDPRHGPSPPVVRVDGLLERHEPYVAQATHLAGPHPRLVLVVEQLEAHRELPGPRHVLVG